jgi:hypothetical protein
MACRQPAPYALRKEPSWNCRIAFTRHPRNEIGRAIDVRSEDPPTAEGKIIPDVEGTGYLLIAAAQPPVLRLLLLKKEGRLERRPSFQCS